MFHFKKISTKLGVVFSCLFMAVLLSLSVVTYTAVTQQAKSIVSESMIASGNVFTRLFLDRATDIQADAALQVKGFGFRSAVSSEDRPTIESALATLQERLGVEALAIVDIDGVAGGQVGESLPLELLSSIISDAYDDPDTVDNPGVVFVNSHVVLIGVIPVRAPDIIGWVVFGDVIDAKDIAELEALAPIRLAASIAKSEAIVELSTAAEIIGGEFSLKQKIPSLLPNEAAILTLTYPVSMALAPYNVLLATLAVLTIFGIAAVSVASWGVARRLTRPISALVDATQRVCRGELATVTVNSKDELARLAIDFNHMSNEIREREDVIKENARTDSQSGFPNRLAMEERLAANISDNSNSHVVTFKVERYCDIRSAIGFEAANKLIISVAEKLSTHPEVNFLAVVSDGLISAMIQQTNAKSVEKIAHSMADSLHATFDIDGSCVDIMAKAGISELSAVNPDTAIRNSIIAVEQATADRSDIEFFDRERYESTRDNLSLMGDLVTALDAGDVTVAYQPKYDLRTQFPIGVEALVRWKHPVRGQVRPDIFIPLAEDTGHIEALTLYVLKNSLIAQRCLKKRGYDLCMSINLSGRLVGNERFAASIAPLLKNRTGEICFEITESAVISDTDRGIKAIEGFTKAGIQISIDDYGSGLSSLAYLKKIPASELKIDKYFVLNIEKSKRDAMLVRSTIDLAHNLGMKVTAEGIETNTAAALLAAMGCDVGQGYGLGLPMELEALIAFLDASKQQETNYVSKAV